ncbi:MAG TPA: PadR family transcriptional regulator [Candidatus Binatus sp.]|nr:PadR family transcriptional regulator [Candidatus Binatus sp.]
MNDLILLSMMLESPKYGYQLKKEAGFIMGQALHNNLVYPSLRRFLEDGWVSKKAVPGERGQTRQQYALSAEGRRHLFERLSEFGESEASSEEAFNLRVGLFPALKPEIREHILGLRGKWLQNRGEKLATLQANLELGKFGGEIVRHIRKQVEMELEWIRHLRRIAKTIQNSECDRRTS